MTTEKYLEFDNVTKQYENFTAVSGLSFSVNKGDIFGFLGPNGAGKSTSIRMLLSLITPTSGDIKLFGAPINQDRNSTIAQVGALVEKPDFYPYLSAERNLDILARLSEVENRQAKIDEVLDLVGLTERRASKVKTFSQGMKQRLGIAQTLLHSPKLVVLDEPANGLDPQGQVDMRELIVRLNKEKGITIIISSHILNEVEQICNRMVIINRGKSVVEGDVTELLTGSKMKVMLTTDDNEKAMSIIATSYPAIEVRKLNEEIISLQIEREAVPNINNSLINSGIKVYSIEPIRSLEEYFIDKTK